MYMLFLLLQGHTPTHHSWWTPKSILVAALLTSILVVVRAAVDIVFGPFRLRYIQSLYVDFLLRLTQGYSEMQWITVRRAESQRTCEPRLPHGARSRRFLSPLH